MQHVSKPPTENMRLAHNWSVHFSVNSYLDANGIFPPCGLIHKDKAETSQICLNYDKYFVINIFEYIAR